MRQAVLDIREEIKMIQWNNCWQSFWILSSAAFPKFNLETREKNPKNLEYRMHKVANTNILPYLQLKRKQKWKRHNIQIKLGIDLAFLGK